MRKALVALVVLAPALARAEDPPVTPAEPAPPPREDPPVTPGDPQQRPQSEQPTFRVKPGKDIIVKSRDDRSIENRVLLGALLGTGAIFGGLGVYYNLDARDAADEVSASGRTGETWDAAHQATYDRAHSSSVKAAVFYSVGGAVLIGAIVTYIATEPKEEVIIIHPHVNPTKGGAVVGAGWSF